MADLVRAVLGDVEKNVGRAYAEAKGLKILDEPTHIHGNPRRATRRGGRPLKPKTSVAAEAAKKTSARSSAAKKTSARSSAAKKTSARSSAAKKTEPATPAGTSAPATTEES